MAKGLIFAAFIVISGFLLLGFLHEQVHVSIYRSYGIESRVDYISHFPHIVTIAEKQCPSDNCRLANNINEVVGYHLEVFYLVFSVLATLIIGALGE